ncbi:hypothetical protein BC938DRAFT_483239 [Jimgerdemannia flammicorona]|uniref:Uncharacterized protein n=1 Tax=Jimgerdemannia flammicorona TaxID=994334 RepID=A0A433QW11_9FUNG|nr:hypothetical protein BC938DRAFT_483239 [Jimgerdemannia flammicorona]
MSYAITRARSMLNPQPTPVPIRLNADADAEANAESSSADFPTQVMANHHSRTVPEENMHVQRKRELVHIRGDQCFRRPSAPYMRHLCDYCLTPIFYSYWTCSSCGAEMSVDCYDAWDKGGVARASRCSLDRAHIEIQMLRMSKIMNETLEEMWRAVEESVILEGTVANTGTMQRESESEWEEVEMVEESVELEGTVAPIAAGSFDRDVLRVSRIAWTPDYFTKQYGAREVEIIDCETGITASNISKREKHDNGKYKVLKLKAHGPEQRKEEKEDDGGDGEEPMVVGRESIGGKLRLVRRPKGKNMAETSMKPQLERLHAVTKRKRSRSVADNNEDEESSSEEESEERSLTNAGRAANDFDEKALPLSPRTQHGEGSSVDTVAPESRKRARTAQSPKCPVSAVEPKTQVMKKSEEEGVDVPANERGAVGDDIVDDGRQRRKSSVLLEGVEWKWYDMWNQILCKEELKGVVRVFVEGK